MRIALDASYSVGTNLTGVGVYSSEIIAGLASAHPDQDFVLCYRPHRFFRAMLSPARPNCRRRPLWETRSVRADVFHGLNQRLPQATYRGRVATFHDLFILTAEYSTQEFRERFARQARQAAERSDLIIAVSRFTAGQVRELLGVENSRIRVIPHGVRPARVPSAASRDNMILNVGAIQKRKNIPRLVRAFEQVPPGWRLVLAGSAGFGAEDILREIEASPRRADIEVRGYVPTLELELLYARAAIFAFPSLDEGFGMPVLEAMAHRVPVVTSNRSALAEVAGGAALQVDPTETDAIAGALNRLIADRTLYHQLVERGLARAASFPWARAVEQTWAVYRELTSGAC
jgi:glycosyltransferase involved in cell wall biosynthesis